MHVGLMNYLKQIAYFGYILFSVCIVIVVCPDQRRDQFWVASVLYFTPGVTATHANPRTFIYKKPSWLSTTFNMY